MREAKFAILPVLLCVAGAAVAEWDIRGNINAQTQVFVASSQHQAEQRSNLSLSGESEFYHTVGESGSFTITPFFRADQSDQNRSHVDLREMIYNYSSDKWEFNAGLGKVFWGVAESVNLVDVINQFDSVEGIGTSDKLGQPLINLSLLRDWGNIDLFVLPGFRQRTFPGIDGRPRTPFVIDTDNAQYESSAEDKHVDVAARVSLTAGDWDLGAHIFHGTARNALIQFNSNTATLVPFYYQTTQLGVDAQATLESWLLKAEMTYNTSDAITDHAEWVTGFEYSFYGIGNSDTDLGVVTEWLYDDRDEAQGQPFQNDLLIGLRFALNDAQSTDALIGVFFDLDGGGQVLSLDASRRLGESFRLSTSAYLWLDTTDDPVLNSFRDEDFIQLEIGYFF